MTKSVHKLVAYGSFLVVLMTGLFILHPQIGAFINQLGKPEILPLATTSAVGRETGFPIPRFVSLASDRARMRVGPGFKYDIDWLFTKQGLPMEVIAEYGNWRQVRDSQGSVGWMHHSLLSGDRTGLVAPWRKDLLPLRSKPIKHAPIVAWMEPALLVHIISCDRTWCNVMVEKPDYSGYLPRRRLWGVYTGQSHPASPKRQARSLQSV